jgi:hypothetical protein
MAGLTSNSAVRWLDFLGKQVPLACWILTLHEIAPN